MENTEKYALKSKYDLDNMKELAVITLSNNDKWFFIKEFGIYYKPTATAGLSKTTRDLFYKTAQTHLLLDHKTYADIETDELMYEWFSYIYPPIKDSHRDDREEHRQEWDDMGIVMDGGHLSGFINVDRNSSERNFDEDIYKPFVMAEDLQFAESRLIKGLYIDGSDYRVENGIATFSKEIVDSCLALIKQTKTEKKNGLNYSIILNPDEDTPLLIGIKNTDYGFIVAPVESGSDDDDDLDDEDYTEEDDPFDDDFYSEKEDKEETDVLTEIVKQADPEEALTNILKPEEEE